MNRNDPHRCLPTQLHRTLLFLFLLPSFLLLPCCQSQLSEDIVTKEPASSSRLNSTSDSIDSIDIMNSSGPPCHSHDSCSNCTSASMTCHWCAFDQQCHAKGSIHGCSIGTNCDATNSSSKKKKKKDDHSCDAHTNCTECYSSSYGCHWCAFDNHCHAKGSVYGCSIGASCENATDHTCRSHTNCTECSLSSYGCHWCEFDDQCHAKGSVYGCAVGVDCYSNDRCQRRHPEWIPTPWSISPVMDGLIVGSFVCVVLCCTGCFMGVRGIQYTVEDLRRVVVPLHPHSHEYSHSQDWKTMTTAKEQPPHEHEHEHEHGQVELSSLPLTTGDRCDEHAIIVDDSKEDINELNEIDENVLDDGNKLEESPLMEMDSHLESLTEPLLPPPTPILPPSPYVPSTMLYITCRTIYIGSLIVITLLTILLFLYFPRMPIIDICSNEMEWKSIIDGLASLKVEASVQILVSIYNANRLSVNVISLSGSITHDGDYIGRYEIPPTTFIPSQSITDVEATVTITPDKWEALELTSEYYKGTLAVILDCHSSVQLPMFPEYPYGYSTSGILIHLDGAEGPRQYCACPKWESKNMDVSMLDLPEFMVV